MKKAAAIIGVLVLIGLTITIFSTDGSGQVVELEGVDEVDVYLSPDCGCCVNHANYLESRTDVEVNVHTENPPSDIERPPQGYESCHTTVMGDYAVEGHIPVEAFETLAEEGLEDGEGITLPGMPNGSPGMGGRKTEAFEIFEYGSEEGIKTFKVV